MNIVSSCVICGNLFTPRDNRQKYCLACVHKPCPRCGGAKKNVRAKLCISCSMTEIKSQGRNFRPLEPLPPIPCLMCGTPFDPRNARQQYCMICGSKGARFRKPCETCGTRKRGQGPLCKKCEEATRFGRPNLKNRREEKPIEQVISEVETIGLFPKKQYTFGYVMGVVFGDGSVFKDVHRNLKRSDGTPRILPVTLYCVKLQVTSQMFAERFAREWEALTERPTRVAASVRTNFDKSTLKGRREQYHVQLFTVEPRHALFGPYLMHLKYESELYELLRFPPEVMQGFIHGMIDSEGYVKGRRIDIANKRITLLDVLALMLDLLGYKSTVYTSPSQNVSHLVTSMDYQKYVG